ncbi:MAG: ABC transporter permease subunit [Spirochaetales bacterium]|jgi:sodium transport system permease protein|nr:ABC transporter permease subunit [Spirochaetales bacterium]
MLKNKILLIAKKEWDRFFKDRRMIITALIFPGLFLYITYAFFAPLMIKGITGNEKAPVLYSLNTPHDIQYIFTEIGIELKETDDEQEILNEIAKKSGDFLLAFPPGFTGEAAAYDPRSGRPAPNIRLYYNSQAAGFTGAYAQILGVLNGYETALANKFDINRGIKGDMAEARDSFSRLLAMILPMLLLMFIFHGAMAAGIESVTGEKERGTLASLLITPMVSHELALGKVLGITIESFLCGLSGALGAVLSVPKFLAGLNSGLNPELGLSGPPMGGDFMLSRYGPSVCLLFLFVILTGALFIAVLVSIVSACAKTVKEAQILLSPMVIILMLAGMSGALYNGGGQAGFYQSLIPIYGSVQSLSGLIALNYDVSFILFSSFFNILYSGLGLVIFTLLLKNEKIVLNKG